MPRTAVISGVGSGLGASLVRKFAAAGYQIGLLARSPGYIQELADELHHKGQTALPVPTDITSPTQVAHGFAQVRDQLGPIDLMINHAGNAAWKEFLDLILSIKVVDSMTEAINHIDQFGSGHSEAILTNDKEAAEQFVDSVDAAAVFVNASTRFNDGGELGLGAEVAISTNKFGARGPMGLRELTSYKWIVVGNGQTRN